MLQTLCYATDIWKQIVEILDNDSTAIKVSTRSITDNTGVHYLDYPTDTSLSCVIRAVCQDWRLTYNTLRENRANLFFEEVYAKLEPVDVDLFFNAFRAQQKIEFCTCQILKYPLDFNLEAKMEDFYVKFTVPNFKRVNIDKMEDYDDW